MNRNIIRISLIGSSDNKLDISPINHGRIDMNENIIGNFQRELEDAIHNNFKQVNTYLGFVVFKILLKYLEIKGYSNDIQASHDIKASQINSAVDVVINNHFEDLPGPVGINIALSVNENPERLRKELAKSHQFSSYVIICKDMTSERKENTLEKWQQLNGPQLKLLSVQDLLQELSDVLSDTGEINQAIEASTEQASQIEQRIQNLIHKFENLLLTATREQEVQEFLQNNPILLGQYAYVIPKKSLGDELEVDLILINETLQGKNYTLIELEKPDMQIFTRDGNFHHDFNHAYRQIIDWDTWLEANKDYLQRELEGFETPNFIIIGGRADTMGDDETRRIRSWNRRQKDVKFLMYDDVLKRASELLESLRRFL
jgi:hypothetical protein